MRRLIQCILLFVFSAASAQTQNPVKAQKKADDSNLSQKMTNDLHTKIPEIGNNNVSWKLTDYGYRAFYTLANLEYMTWYDKMGTYLETLVKTPWDDRVPAILKMELDNSDYNTYTIITYWVSINSSHENYCLEMMDKDGKSQVLWSDENGKISRTPAFVR